MIIILKNIKVSELTKGYEDKAEEGVRGYDGTLNIRPAYQREFIYKEKQRNEVINTVRKSFPLNTMYWAVAGEGYELMDGQQRTVSICQYVQGDFAVEIDGSPMFFNNLTSEKQQQILDYEVSVYVCEGAEGEKLDWFKIINIAGEKLTDQELRNAIYTGPWLADAKRWFSRSGCPAYQIGEKYVNGSPIRQELLEKAIEWISGGKIEDYMSRHQHDSDAQELWQYYQEVIAWVERIFPEYRKIMKGLDWGKFYNEHKDDKLNASKLEQRIVELIEDDEVDNKKGIYEYLLTNNEKTLSLRMFDEKTKVKIYEKQKGICPTCKKHYDIGSMEADHIIPWSKGGKTTSDNCQMLCKMDNRTKSGK
ncbi:MAG: HNH endonuclease [Betaproteobacteria bacterium HGW-Betaproteobacteria-22]|nr:MAG: HNH endonuclease [Betaproteobacteria bacterium HGW-Betaproteobacteria-22]